MLIITLLLFPALTGKPDTSQVTPAFGTTNFNFNTLGVTPSKTIGLPPLAQSTPKIEVVSTSLPETTSSKPATVLSRSSTTTAGKNPDCGQAGSVVPRGPGEMSGKGDEFLSQEALSNAFLMELDTFTKELATLRVESERVIETPIGDDGEVSAIRKQTKQLTQKTLDVCSNVKVSDSFTLIYVSIEGSYATVYID